MTESNDYSRDQPSLASIQAGSGWVLLEFGVSWCPHCQAAQRAIAEALSAQPAIVHRKLEDGRGRALGRAFGVKLWPTLVLLHDGVEAGRLVRPTAAAEVEGLLSGTGGA